MDVNGGSKKPIQTARPTQLEEVHFKPGSVKFSIVHFSGDRKQAVTDQGRKVVRQEKIFVKEYGHYVPMAPYITHFIFEEKRPGYCSYQCTCGSPGVIVGHQQYKDDMSATPTGELFVCLYHAQTGRHKDGSEM